MLDWKWNSERPLVFAHVILTSTLGTCKARDIRVMIDHCLDLWERCIHTGLVGDALEEGRATEDNIYQHKEEEEDILARSFHITLLLENLWQAICRATNRKGGGGLYMLVIRLFNKSEEILYFLQF